MPEGRAVGQTAGKETLPAALFWRGGVAAGPVGCAAASATSSAVLPFLWISNAIPVINGGGGNSWITLRLRGGMGAHGTGSNADAIGARVHLTAGGKTQAQEVHAGSSYLSMHAVELEFGLGDAAIVDEIAVKWRSGRTLTLTDVDVNQTLVILEPES